MPAPLQGFTEAITRHVARGWARDPAEPARRVVVRAVAQGRVIGEAVADLFRGDVRDAGFGDGNCGFVIDLSEHSNWLGGVAVTLCDAASGAVLQGSPVAAADPPSLGRFLSRWDGVPAPVLARLRRMMRHRTRGRGVTVVAYDRDGLAGLIASLRAQLCDRWELLVRGGVDLPVDRRIRALPMMADPMAAARFGIVMVVTGRDDRGQVVLERDAIWHVLRAAEDPRPAVFLWDFARVHAGGAVDLVCRPAFSPDAFCSHGDTGGAFAVRRSARWGAPAMMILPLSEEAPVAHVPRVLHRTPDGAAGPSSADLLAALEHCMRLAPGIRVRRPDAIEITWPAAKGRTLAVVPTRNQGGLLRRCLESLFRTRGDAALDVVVIDHESDEPETRRYLREIAGLVRVMPYEGAFDFSQMNNLAVAQYGAEAETLLFLNNDTEAIEAGWLERMRSLAVRPDVGAVGALLLYGDRRVQHGGVVLGFDGSATHAHRLVQAYAADGSRVAGYDGQLVALREVSAVTAACMVMRREVFEAVGGFDTALPVGFNDTDLCLRVRAAGYRVLQDGQSVLFHHESRTRHVTGQWLHPPDTTLFKARHAALIAKGDPFYNPNLRLEVQDHELRPDCLPGGAPRLTFPIGFRPAPGAGPAATGKSRSAARPRRKSSG